MDSNSTNLNDLLATLPSNPVILLEGTRNITPETGFVLQAFAAHLSQLLPNAIFRSGNATGSDAAFMQGLINCNHQHLELALPYSNHRKKAIAQKARIVALDELPNDEIELLKNTSIAANAGTKSMMQYFDMTKKGRAIETAKYLLRDILKLTGSVKHNLAPANLAIFMVDETSTKKGGTGHTMLVADYLKIPYQTQRGWAFDIPRTIYNADELKTIDDLCDSRNADLSYHVFAETDEEKQAIKSLNEKYMKALMNTFLRY